ncbi:MAG: hypothetical protein HY286_11135 [Planctomycetes bacterium]|nr:hypothetical protein [Planctomycetota bacterium]
MTSYTVEIDTGMNCAMVEVKENSGDVVDFQIDYSPSSGKLDFHDRWLLERDYGAEFIAAMVKDIEGKIKAALGK